MDESAAVIDLMGFQPPDPLKQLFSSEFQAPENEFVVDEIDGPTPFVSIKHYDTRLENKPRPSEDATNMSFEAYVAPSKKEIRIHHLKYDGRNDQVNSIRSGSEILHRLTNVGKRLNHDVVVDEDVSQVSLNNSYRTKVDLAKLKILERGYSFYNKAGFYPPDFESVYQHNQVVRATKLGKYLRKERNIDDFNEAFDTDFSKDTPLSAVGEVIAEKIRPSIPLSDEAAGELVELLNKLNFKVNDRNLKYKNV
jgi:hypothetical protein